MPGLFLFMHGVMATGGIQINYNPGKMASTYIMFDLAWPPDLFLTKQYQWCSLLPRIFLSLEKIFWSII